MAVKSEGMFTYHILQDRERKNLAILELIRKRSPISKAEISRTLGYNIVTITNYLDYYINKKMVLEVGLDISSGGRRPELLELNAKTRYVVGVDISPDTISAIVTDLNIKMISSARAPRPPVNMEALVPSAINVIDEAIVKSGIEHEAIKTIGIGISGIVDYYSGTIRDTDPARGRTKVDFIKFIKAIEQRFSSSVFIGNDASCAAFGEKALNPGADVDNLVYAYSDVGCGIIVHGDVYIGSSGCSGETQILFESRRAGEKMPLERRTFMKPQGVDLGVVSEARKLAAKGTAAEILALAGGNAAAITKDNVIDAAKRNDEVALELIRFAAKNLSIRIAYFINFLNPAVVIIGGGMEKAGDIFLDPLKASVRRFAFEEPMNIVKIVPSLLGENAVVMGASALAAREVFIQA
ncbi:MAG: ROK family protein [Candidatus Omnitrophica bacterium]|nr:ROK family protein [Candidatus Omnitrophota bacterium]